MNRPPFLPSGRQLGMDLAPDAAETRRNHTAQFGVLSLFLVALCVALAFLLASAWDASETLNDTVSSARCSMAQELDLSTADRIAADQAILAYRAGVRDEAERQAHAAAVRGGAR